MIKGCNTNRSKKQSFIVFIAICTIYCISKLYTVCIIAYSNVTL